MRATTPFALELSTAIATLAIATLARAMWAYDFGVPLETPVHEIRDGLPGDGLLRHDPVRLRGHRLSRAVHDGHERQLSVMAARAAREDLLRTARPG